jgi:hypothetical protein
VFPFDPKKTLSVAVTSAGPPIPIEKNFAPTEFQVGHTYMLQIRPYVENYTTSSIVSVGSFLGQNHGRLIFRDAQATAIFLHPDQIEKSQDMKRSKRTASFVKKQDVPTLYVKLPGLALQLDVQGVPVGDYVKFEIPDSLPEEFSYTVEH